MSKNTTDLDEQILLALAKPYLHERAEAVKQLISNREKLARIDEDETIKATYGVWYNKLSKKHGVKQEIPHTAFHQIIEERITTLRKELEVEL